MSPMLSGSRTYQEIWLEISSEEAMGQWQNFDDGAGCSQDFSPIMRDMIHHLDHHKIMLLLASHGPLMGLFCCQGCYPYLHHHPCYEIGRHSVAIYEENVWYDHLLFLLVLSIASLWQVWSAGILLASLRQLRSLAPVIEWVLAFIFVGKRNKTLVAKSLCASI